MKIKVITLAILKGTLSQEWVNILGQIVRYSKECFKMIK